MHTNYYFLRQLAPALTAQLRGYRVASCFSQEKDELVIGLTDGGREFWLKAQLGATFPALALPETFQRARANSVDLFPELLGEQVETVAAWPQDRVLQVNFRSGARWCSSSTARGRTLFSAPLPTPRPSCSSSACWPMPTCARYPRQGPQQRRLPAPPPGPQLKAARPRRPQNPLNPLNPINPWFRQRLSCHRPWPTYRPATCAPTATTGPQTRRRCAR
ncbi:hypothetical protein [Hymenobacter coccineus]|uniref:hypothetical protein n=1 Tax=Hymenobacter coccineus TaxID=1908235 RepID=UPI000A5FF1B7|nr:hypothetical protein [Hymenobacter coccineus]